MADLDKIETEPQVQLLERIRGARCVMLGSPNPGEHMQPMAAQIDDALIETDPGAIYFFSDKTSDLGKAVLMDSGPVMLNVVEKDYQACVSGHLYPNTDRTIIDRFWNPIAASWYPGGKDDPKLLILRFEMMDAAIWASSKNPVKFLYETAKANLTKTTPDVGKKTHIKAA